MINCIIVDDEHRGCEVLKKILSTYCEDLHIMGIAHDAAEAYALVEQKAPELVFLDIEMPRGDGFSFLNKFDQVPFKTIFTTAHEQYAIKAIRYAPFDYLLKPLSIEQVQEVINRYKYFRDQEVQSKAKQAEPGSINRHKHPGFNKLAVPTLNGVDFIEVNDVIWLQASDKYTIFHLKGKKQFISSYNLRKYEELLCEKHPFIRIHHSHIVNTNHITRLSRGKNCTIELSEGAELEVSVRKRESLLELIGQ